MLQAVLPGLARIGFRVQGVPGGGGCGGARRAARAQVITEYGDEQLPEVLAAVERMSQHLTAAVVSNDRLFTQKARPRPQLAFLITPAGNCTLADPCCHQSQTCCMYIGAALPPERV